MIMVSLIVWWICLFVIYRLLRLFSSCHRTTWTWLDPTKTIQLLQIKIKTHLTLTSMLVITVMSVFPPRFSCRDALVREVAMIISSRQNIDPSVTGSPSLYCQWLLPLLEYPWHPTRYISLLPKSHSWVDWKITSTKLRIRNVWWIYPPACIYPEGAIQKTKVQVQHDMDCEASFLLQALERT